MNNKQKGFVVPLILVILAVIVAGGVGYVSYEQGKSAQVNQENEQFMASTTDQTDLPATTASTGNNASENDVFSASPSSGAAPLTVQFAKVESAGDISIEYGDGTSCSTADPDGTEGCSVFTHTYAELGTYIATVYRHLPTTEIGSTTVTVTGTAAGMSHYIDPSFGFSFWYPTSWTVTPETVTSLDHNGWFQGGLIVKEFNVHGTQPSSGVTIQEFHSSGLSITELGQTKSANPVGVDQKYFFDPSVHAWMYENLTETPSGSRAPGTITAADVANNTMGGLHIFFGAKRFGSENIIPLSATDFLVVSSNAPTSPDQKYFVNTISATDPSVATPVNQTEQVQTIQAEASAYADVSGTSQNTIQASLGGGLTDSQTVDISKQTYIPVLDLELKSQNEASILHSLGFVVNTGATTPSSAILSDLFGNASIKVNGQTYTGTLSMGGCDSKQCGPSGGNPTLSFSNLNVILPTDTWVPVTVYVTLPANSTSSLNGQLIQLSLPGSEAMVSAVDSDGITPATPGFSILLGNKTTLVN
jgi:hypothetical protein